MAQTGAGDKPHTLLGIGIEEKDTSTPTFRKWWLRSRNFRDRIVWLNASLQVKYLREEESA